MSRKKFLLLNLGLLAILWVVLLIAFSLIDGQPTWVYMVVGGFLAGCYGVAQRILREKRDNYDKNK